MNVYKCSWNGTDYPAHGETTYDAVLNLALCMVALRIASRDRIHKTIMSCDGEAWRIEVHDTPESTASRWSITLVEVVDTDSLPAKVREMAAAKRGSPLPRFVEA